MARMIAILTAVFLAGAALAACTPQALIPPEPSRKADLDALFQRLQSTGDETEAVMIEAAIRHAWSASPRQDVAKLLSDSLAALHHDDYETALELTDQLIKLAPQLPAAWNLRATLHYLTGQSALAIKDAAAVLTLEPRHFGAWSGLGRIMLERGDKALALRAFEAALAINPHLAALAEEARQLRMELTGRPI